MRRANKLSAVWVGKVVKPGYYGDGAGLWLQVSKTGSKSWVFRYTMNGKTRDMGLGSLRDVSLAAARMRASECRALLANGADPLEHRNAARQAEALEKAKLMTFDQCASAYIEAHRSSWRNAKHAAQWASTLAAYVSPVFGALPVAEVDTALVVKVLKPIWGDKIETATRLRGRIEAIIDWATTSGYRQGENPARWKGHLQNLLADPARSKRVEHHPALPWQQVGTFMAELRQREGIAARALEFAILTAARSSEVRGAVWSEIDLDAALWVIPASRMKGKREHHVPIPAGAVALLKALPRVNEFVFPGAKTDKPLSDMTLAAVLKRMGRNDITVHGFRSTFRDWAAEATAFPREAAEFALAHRLPDKVELAYMRTTLFEKRARLMQDWCDFCERIPGTASVTPIRRKTA